MDRHGMDKPTPSPTPHYDSLDYPEVRVRPAVMGVHWAILDEEAPPDGTVVKARLMRSGLAVGRIHTEMGMRTLRPLEQWSATSGRSA